jgi:hypothetical protein
MTAPSIRRTIAPRIADVPTVDEKTATFFVDRALPLIRDAARARQTVAVAMIEERGFNMSNPKALDRTAVRLKRALSDAVVGLSIKPGRTASTLTFADLDVLTGNGGERLAVLVNEIVWKRGFKPLFRDYTLLTISRHALIRAVQRAGVRDIDGVRTFARRLGRDLLLPAMHAAGQRLTTPGTKAWLMPLALDDHASAAGGVALPPGPLIAADLPLLAVLVARPSLDEVCVATTVLRLDQLDPTRGEAALRAGFGLSMPTDTALEEVARRFSDALV